MATRTVKGIDFTLPTAPPLVDPPLSLLGLATVLIDIENKVELRQMAMEKRASVQLQLDDLDAGREGDFDQPSEADNLEDARKALLQQEQEWAGRVAALTDEIADQQRWEQGFRYLPELGNDEAITVYAPGQPTSTPDGINQDEFYWGTPFQVTSRDIRSTFGMPNTDYESRAARARRSVLAHESWQCEREWWGGTKIPTNYHLTASPHTPTTSPTLTTDPWPTPAPAPGTVLGTKYGRLVSMAALDQAIAEGDGGTGMIHATPYVVQCWMATFPFIRDTNGRIYTVNHNLIVPGYGYPGTGPDQTDRTHTLTVNGSAVTISGSTFTTADIGRQIIDPNNVIVQSARSVVLLLVATTTAATAAPTTFTAEDVGRAVSGFGIPKGTTITTVVDGAHVILSAHATYTTTTTATVGTDTYILKVTTTTTATLSQPGTQNNTGVMTIKGTGGTAGGAPAQWAYATEQVYDLRGALMTRPYDLREMSPDLPVDNTAPVRAQQAHCLITNRLVRAAIVVDTTAA